MIRPRFVFCLALLGILTACGGGGGEEAPPPAEPASVSVGGTLAGLGTGKSVTLAHVDGAGATVQSAVLNANGSYSLRLPSGTAYSLRVVTQPAGQTCAIANASGTASADVNNISVTCADDFVPPEARTISGTVAGLGAGKAVVLQLTANGTTQEATVNTDASFSFPQAITGTYTITVKTPPAGQGCTVANSQGTAAEGAAISVACTSAALNFKLGGTVTGNIGVVALRNASNGETIALNSNGAFSFTQPVLQGSAYSIVVFDQSASQTCSVVNGSGTASADVTNLQVSCTAVVVVAPPAIPAPSTPTGLTMTYGVKSFQLAWGTVTAPVGGGSVTYRVFEDADGAGPAASAQIGGALAGGTYTHVVSALLHTRLNAQYRVRACNAGGCSTATAAITPNLTQAIGYFKASNTGADDEFGYSVAISGDGDTLAVGARLENSDAAGINGNQANNNGTGAGAVYVFVRTGGAWSQQAYLKASNNSVFLGGRFGSAVALSSDGSTLAVGAVGEDSSAAGVNGDQFNTSASASGAVYVFSRSAGAWSQQAYVKASNPDMGDSFGGRVALSGDGNTLAVASLQEQSNAIGINGDQSNNSLINAGAVYVFARSGAIWSQQAYVKASNTGSDLFGSSLALSGDGGTLAVGAPFESSMAVGINGVQADESALGSGAVYVFLRSGAAWSQQAYVKASNTNAGDAFGSSLALSGDGNTLAVGAPGEDSRATGIHGDQSDNTGYFNGAVYVFLRGGATWVQQAYVKSSQMVIGGQFGAAVALSGDGSVLAVGSYGESSAATGVQGNQADDSETSAGAAYLFARTAGVWAQQAYLKASNTQVQDEFGSRLALSADGKTLAVGAIYEDSSATGINGNQADNSMPAAGAVYIY